ncbi:MAG: hypothetical protein ACI4UU_00475 [Clostridia bacterium]
MPITKFKDEKEKEEYLKQLRANREENVKKVQEEQKKANQLFNKYATKNNEIDTKKNSAFNENLKKDKTTVQLPTASNKKSKTSYASYRQNIPTKVDVLPTARLSTTEEKNSFKGLKDGDMYKLTKGITDDRNYLQKVGDKLSFIGKSAGSGAVTGITGIAQAGLTDMANEMNKGEEKETLEVGTNFIKSLLDMTNPMSGMTNSLKKAPERINEILQTISDKDKNIYQKMANIGINATDDVINDVPAKSLFNSSNQIVGKIAPKASEEILNINNVISQPSQKLQEYIAEEAEKQDELTRLLGGASQAVGNMLPSIGVTALTGSPTAGLATMGMSAKGQATQEALNKGAELDQAVKVGNTKAMIEIGSEMLTGGVNIFGKGALDDIITNGIDKKVKNEVANFLIKKGLDIPGEILEETISDVLGTAIDKGTVDPNASYSISDWSETAITTMLSTIVLNALTGGYGKKAYNANKVQVQESLNNQNLQQNTTNNVNNVQEQQIIPSGIKMPQNQNMEQIDNILPVANEQNNYLTKNYEESAKKYNIDINNKTVKSINRVTQERGIKTTYNADLFTDNNTNAIWKTSTDVDGIQVREIILNPNADTNKTLQNVIMHELTHDLEGTAEYNELKDLILNYDKGYVDFEKARKSLEDIYSKVYDRNNIEFQSLVDNEAVADILGNKLGDQNFINNLTMEKPTLGRKIYNWVVDKLNKINKLTGYSSERLFWADVKNKFENAYRQDYKGNNNNSKYSIQTDSNGNKYVRVDTDQNIFEGKSIKEQTKIAQEYILNNFRENGLLKDDNTINISRKTATEYTHPKNGLDNTTYSSKMKASTELDNLLEISQFIKSEPDDGRHIFAKDGWDYYETVFKVGDKTYSGWLNIANGKNGKLLYDITNIKERASNYSVKTVSVANSSINNSITPQNENVNTTKYSIQESENNSGSFNLSKNNTELSEEAKKQLHRYIGLDNQTLNEKITEVIENKENMLQEVDRLRKEYKEFQNTEEFKNALNDFATNDVVPKEVNDIMDKAQKYADKIRYYDNAYNEYQAQYEAINSILMGNSTDTRSTDNIVRDAEEHFGITKNFKETPYIDTNGNQIDFSGRHEGGPSGSRTLDHRQINEIDVDMNTFIDMGNIRIIPEGGGINLKIEPNMKQYNKLREYIDSVNGEIYIDIDKTNTTYDSAEYKAGTSSSKIISDIQYYFKNGEFPKQSELAQFRYSVQKNNAWQQYLDENYKSTGKGQTIQEVKLPIADKQQAPTAKNNTLETGEYTRQQKNKILNPSEISNLSREDANTTPKLNSKKYERGNKQSNFLSNIAVDSQFLNEDLRKVMSQEENIRYYKGITNEKTLEKAYNSLKDGGEKETLNWFSKNDKNTSAEDVAKGWILLKQYQDSGDYQGAVEVAKKMRQMGTSAGQAVQAYNILSRLTPEGMFYYAQSELNEVYSKMVEGKSKEWIEANQDKFNLTQEETQTILDTMKEVSELEDGREKNVKLAQIQKLVSDKIPATTGQSVKAWMRISMLFNPKTQVRNVMGNAVVLPVNATSDVFAGALDKLISKKTGIRTTGITKEGIKGYAKGFGKGVFESYDDFKKGINTRNVEDNRFEIGEGKSFKDNGIGKALNRVDNILSFALDVGDRGFYEATFTNSINNQMVLNNTTEVNQDMIDIATNEALQRTWQDSNNYTQAVLSIRNILNKANIKGYGLGDVLIPFAKTPANLTKAIVDYSPVGLTKTLALDAKKFTNSLQNGQYSAQLQHNFVQNVGKGLAGTLLYVLAYGLAKAGIATGESDDDKDIKNFMKNSLGISSYSIKIGDKSFTYDWAQPVATPLAIMTNYVKYSKDNPDANAIEKAIKAMDIGTEQLLQQSFMESLNTVLNGNGTTLENLSQAILELPARAIPTFSKQIADMIDSTQRTSFEYNEPVQSAINSIKAKIPGLSQTLPVAVDTLGNDIQKYGGNNNLWNVMFNPANTNKGQLSKVGEEIYNVYMQTGDTTIFPRTAPYYINSNGEKITMTSTQRSNFQKVSGKYVEESLNSLLTSKNYKKLSNDEKAKVINEIISDSYSKAKYDVLGLDTKEYSKTREILKDVKASTYYSYKINTAGVKNADEKIQILVDSNYSNKEKTVLYENYILSSEDETYPLIKNFFTEDGLNIDKYLNYKQQDFSSDKKDDGTLKGKTITGSAEKKRRTYLNEMKISYTQRLLLLGTQYKLESSERTTLANYIKSSNLSKEDKLKLYSKLKGFTVYKDGTVEW